MNNHQTSLIDRPRRRVKRISLWPIIGFHTVVASGQMYMTFSAGSAGAGQIPGLSRIAYSGQDFRQKTPRPWLYRFEEPDTVFVRLNSPPGFVTGRRNASAPINGSKHHSRFVGPCKAELLGAFKPLQIKRMEEQ